MMLKPNPRHLAVALAITTSFTAAPTASASCVNHEWSNPRLVPSNIYVNTNQLSNAQKNAATAGMNQWNGCSTVSDIPHMTATQPSSDFRQLNVIPKPGYHATDNRVCGEFIVQEIRIYQYARNENNEIVPCWRSDILQDTIAHEIGHAIGFGHIGSGCSGYVMDNVRFNNGNYTNRGVQPSECQTASQMNFTVQEAEDIENDNDTYNSPVVIDLDRNNFHFTDERVLFDIDGDGQVEWTNWTSPGERDAFLARDLNGNGMIDSGRELFGDATLLADGSAAPHGYIALGELDKPEHGGNGDGHLDESDTAFDDLLLWLDHNQDGISQSNELRRVGDSALKSVDLRFRSFTREDDVGNLLLFFSRAWLEGPNGKRKKTWTTDVFFLGSEIN